MAPKILLGLFLFAALPQRGLAESYPSDPPVETTRSTALRAVYFPFLAIGHGVVLIGKYAVAYPIYYAFKPLYDAAYESSEDPHEMSLATSGSE